MGKFIDKNLWNKMDYNTYLKVRNGILIGEIVTGLGISIGTNLLTTLIYSSFLYPITLDSLLGVSKTKDVVEVRKLYDILLNNYSELNKTFELFWLTRVK